MSDSEGGAPPQPLVPFAGLPAVLAALFIVSSAVGYAQLVNYRADPDMFWHIAAGRWILTHGTVPHTDVLSWTGQPLGLPWTSQEWLFGTVIYAVWRLGGFPAVYACTSFLVGVAVLTVFTLANARSANPLRSLIVAAATLVAMMPLMAPRPQVLSYV